MNIALSRGISWPFTPVTLSVVPGKFHEARRLLTSEKKKHTRISTSYCFTISKCDSDVRYPLGRWAAADF